MKYDNKLQESIVRYFKERADFYFHGYTGTFFFNTWNKFEDKYIIKSNKPIGDKDMMSYRVMVYSNNYAANEQYGVEIKIEAYMWGYQSEEPFFQGWVESVDDLEIILKAVGL